MKNRRSIRLPEYDYSWPGYYFVTITTHNKSPIFGKIEDHEVKLNALGRIADINAGRSYHRILRTLN